MAYNEIQDFYRSLLSYGLIRLVMSWLNFWLYCTINEFFVITSIKFYTFILHNVLGFMKYPQSS